MKKILRFFLVFTIIIFFIYIYARFIEPYSIETKTPKITSEFISDELSNIKIVQFSDTHISEYYTLENLMNTVEKINNLNPDIVFFTGDLIDDYSKCTIDTNDIAYVLSLIDCFILDFHLHGKVNITLFNLFVKLFSQN